VEVANAQILATLKLTTQNANGENRNWREQPGGISFTCYTGTAVYEGIRAAADSEPRTVLKREDRRHSRERTVSLHRVP